MDERVRKMNDYLIGYTAGHIYLFLWAAVRTKKKRKTIGYAMNAGMAAQRLIVLIAERMYG